MKLAARAFLFDFDGTLVDSGPLHAWAFREVLASAAPATLTHFEYETIKGMTTRDSFARLGIGDACTLDWCVAAKQRLYREAVRCGRLRAYSGARQILETVRANRAKNYLVTSGSADSVRHALDSCGLEEFFAGVITAEDAPAGKPAPAPYLACLVRFGIHPVNAVAIEDSPAGVSSAQGAGLHVIGVHNPDIATTADLYFDDFAALAAVFADADRTLHID
jgi:beta-phosphoglucomutase